MLDRRFNKMLLFLFITGVSVGLLLLVPFFQIVEILFIALLLLILVWGVSEVDNQLHLHQIKQQWREINIRRFANGKSHGPRRSSLY